MKRIILINGRQIRIEGRYLRIARLEADGFHFLSDPGALLEILRSCGTNVDLFTFMQKVTEPEPRFQYPLEWDNVAALPISTFENWWDKQINFKARNKAKQAEKKGVVLREVPFDNALAAGICEIYNECPIRQGRRFPHYGKTLETVWKESATFLEDSIFIGAFWESRLIGFVKLTMDQERTIATTMNIVSLVSQRDKAPTNALIAHAVRACANRRLSYLVYAKFVYGNKQPDSLADFKERNAFQRVNVPRYYVPLTRRGALAFRLQLHHKLIERLPGSWIERLRKLRNDYYNRKMTNTPEAFQSETVQKTKSPAEPSLTCQE